jgi:hypothetical protein
MAVQFLRISRLISGAPYAYAVKVHTPELISTAGACPLDEEGRVVARVTSRRKPGKS